MTEEKKLPDPEGYCRFCKKPIYIYLDKHEVLCQLEKKVLSGNQLVTQANSKETIKKE